MIIEKVVYGQNKEPYHIKVLVDDSNISISLFIFDRGDIHLVKRDKYMFIPTKEQLISRIASIVKSYESSKEVRQDELNLDDWDGDTTAIV